MVFLSLDTLTKKIIFFGYIFLWVSYGLLNQNAKSYKVQFNSASAVFLQSCIKLGLASYMFITQDGAGKLSHLIQALKNHYIGFFFYLIPAGLYAIYDVLSYINLSIFDPTTYFLLLQFRLVVTGWIYQHVLGKGLSSRQWIALGIITCGCIVKTLGDSSSLSSSSSSNISLTSYVSLFIQILSCTFAGVYNELLIKKKPQMVLNLQNMFMYMDSLFMLFVSFVLGVHGNSLSHVLEASQISSLFSISVFPMILIMSFIGLVTSLFLKHLDSVRKSIASALELVCLPLLSFIFFQSSLSISLFISVALVGFGTYYYSLPSPDDLSSSSSTPSLPSTIKHTLKEKEVLSH